MRELDLLGVVPAACSMVPLIFWRRSPLGMLVVTAAAGVLLAGLGYRTDLLLGPAAGLDLLAVSRQPQTSWTWGTTANSYHCQAALCSHGVHTPIVGDVDHLNSNRLGTAATVRRFLQLRYRVS